MTCPNNNCGFNETDSNKADECYDCGKQDSESNPGRAGHGVLIDRIVRRRELDKFKQETEEEASRGECEGNCGEHSENVSCVRVFDPKNGFDWGYFAYCDKAKETDIERGLFFSVDD